MKARLIFTLLFGTALVACTSMLEDNTCAISPSQEVFFASFENSSQTKALLGDNGKLLWQPGESIGVYVDGESLGSFCTSCTGPSETTGFYQLMYDDDTHTYHSIEVPETGRFIAIYPYVSEDVFDLYKTSFSLNYPTVISASALFPAGSFYSVAISDNHNLSFKHASGSLRFTLTEENISKIIIKANNPDDVLSGTIRYDIDENGVPYVLSISNASSELEVRPNSSNKYFDTNKEYFISLPPLTYTDGLTFEFYTPYSTGQRVISKEVKINRAEIALLTNATKDVSFDFLDGNDDFYHYLYEAFGNVSANVGIYRPYEMMNNLCGDDMLTAGMDPNDLEVISVINKFRYDSTSGVIMELYSKYLSFIQNANIFLNFSYGKNETLDKQISEIRVLRAFCQMMLTLGWHTPPLYDSNKTNLPNSSYKDNLDWCANECLLAAEYLPERESTSDKQNVWIVSKGFAQALAGKAFLYNSNYNEAKSSLKKVIDSGKYALVPGERYWENFHIEGEANEEKIFEHYIENAPIYTPWNGPYGFPIIMQSTWMQANLFNWRTDAFATSPIECYSEIASSGGGWGGLAITESFAKEFYENDKHSHRFDATLKHIDEAVYDMEYGDYYINSMTYDQKKASTLIGISRSSGLYGQSFWLPFKVITKASDTIPQYGSNVDLTDFTFMRYAEVLLMYAEACLQVGDQTEAKNAINAIRARAGISELDDVNMDILKKEKSYELWMEGTRWYDIVRWGDAEKVAETRKNIPTLYDKLFRNPSENENVVWENGNSENSRFYIIYTDYGLDSGFQVGKHEYFPFPEDVLKSNPNMVQNPGW